MDGLWAKNGTRLNGSLAKTKTKVQPTDVIVCGELAMGICGLLSTISTTVLFLWITYKFLKWQNARPRRYSPMEEDTWGVNAFPGPPTRRSGRANDGVRLRDRGRGTAQARHDPHASRHQEEYPGPNTFLILIYSLLLGDINKSIGFTISIYWFKEGKVLDSAACWAQGWFINSGRLSTAVFFTLISLHTFSIVVLGRAPGRLPLYIAITCLWTLTYLMTAAGIIMTRNGKDVGGWYAPLTIWVCLSPRTCLIPPELTYRPGKANARLQCWVNDKYSRMRFWMEYFWIFLSICLTTFLYTLVFISIYLRRRWVVDSCGSYSSQRFSWGRRHEGGNQLAPPRPTGHHPAFLVYPFLYLICTVPVGTIRLLTDAGYDVGLVASIISGVMVALHGALNVLLWTLTLVYLPREQLDEVGLSHFMRTPANRQYGNMVWIQGASDRHELEEGTVFDCQQQARYINRFSQLNRAKSFCFLPSTLLRTSHGSMRGSSQISFRRASRASDTRNFMGNSIHMDTFTAVVEERCHGENTS